MALSKEQRDALKDEDFAVPAKRLLPLVDAPLVLMAAKNLDFVKGLTDEERETGRVRIHNRGVEIGVNNEALRHCKFTVEGMALDIPIIKDHPNRHPFTGIMTRLNIASDFPVGGTTRKKVIIPGDIAEAAIPTLLGMAIDYKPNFDGHDRKSKIGIITEAYIGEEDTVLGTPLHIAGFFYAADFPDEVAAIQSLTEHLGFSYEAEAFVSDLDSDPWVCTSCEFTGAAVLYKDKAAFTRTSIAASNDQGDLMSPEEIAALQAKLAASQAENESLKEAAKKTDLSAASLQHLVKPHADALRTLAVAMCAAGIGADSASGHAAQLNKMADHMEAEAILGRVPSTYHAYMYAGKAAPDLAAEQQTLIANAVKEATKPFEDMVASLQTKVSDAEKRSTELAAGKAAELEASAGNRKSMHPSSTALLKKIGLDAAADKFDVQTLDAACQKAGLTSADSIALKLNLKAAGLIGS